MQFKVPQNIDMADRIVGPLTLVQFLYLLVGGIIIYFMLITFAPVSSTLFLLAAIPTGLFTLALAFLKIQDQPFPRFVGSFILYLKRPKMRMWHKEGLDPNLVITAEKKENNEKVAVHKSIKRSELEQLAQALDTGTQVNRQPIEENPPAVKNQSIAPPNHLKRGRPIIDTLGGKK